MGQNNLKRSQFEARQTIINPVNDDKQELSFTGYYEVGDIVDVVDVDAAGNITAVLADNLSVLSIAPNQFVVLSAVVDTTAAVGVPMLVCQQIDDGQDAVDRLYRRKFTGEVSFEETEAITGRKLDTPIVGQGTYFVEDATFYRVGDTVDVLANEGIVVTGASVVAVSPNADAANNQASIVINASPDTNLFTSPFFVLTSITVQEAIRRNQERIDEIDKPVENEDIGVGDGLHTCFEVANLFKVATSKFSIDGVRKKLGTAGTRASLTQGAGNAQMIFTSNLLGLLGNEVEAAVTAGAGLVITVTRAFSSSSSAILSSTLYRVSITNNGGAATAKDIADAINAHAVAKRIMMVQYGGTGLGVAATFAATNLAGGLDNGTGDYAELEQIYENVLVNTGYKWLSFHIRPNERNRMKDPVSQDEELNVDYRRPVENVNR